MLCYDGWDIGVVRLDQRRPGGRGVVRLVAIRREVQRQGHGRIMATLVEARARMLGIRELLLNAAPDAVGFHSRTGWREGVWDSAELCGIAANCVQMRKSIG